MKLTKARILIIALIISIAVNAIPGYNIYAIYKTTYQPPPPNAPICAVMTGPTATSGYPLTWIAFTQGGCSTYGGIGYLLVFLFVDIIFWFAIAAFILYLLRSPNGKRPVGITLIAAFAVLVTISIVVYIIFFLVPLRSANFGYINASLFLLWFIIPESIRSFNTVLPYLVGLFSLLPLVTAYGLIKCKKWARKVAVILLVLVLIGAVLDLFMATQNETRGINSYPISSLIIESVLVLVVCIAGLYYLIRSNSNKDKLR
jgi:hypothetical protein